MKKSILVLSALLTLVVSGVCLQSCSSEYDEYTTEEYGYYTEEEIAAIKEIAERYNTTINVDETYHGKKVSLEELEGIIIQFANLSGDYQLIESENEERYRLMKKTTCINRTKARAMELGTTGSAAIASVTVGADASNCTIYMSWTLATNKREGIVTLSVDAPFQLGGNNLSLVNSTITPYYISIFENISVSYKGVSARYCISGTYYAGGMKEFKVTHLL